MVAKTSSRVYRVANTRFTAKVEANIQKQSDAWVRGLCKAADRELAHRRKIWGVEKMAPKNAARAFNVNAAFPRAQLAAKSGPTLTSGGGPGPVGFVQRFPFDLWPTWPIWIGTFYQPPYMGGFPIPAQITYGRAPFPGIAGVAAYAEAIPSTGRMELLAQTYNGDPTAQRSTNLFYRNKRAGLLAPPYHVVGSQTNMLDIQCDFSISGSSLVDTYGMPAGWAYVALMLRLRADIFSGGIGSRESTYKALWRNPVITDSSALGVQRFSLPSHNLSIDLPVAAGLVVLVSASVELIVGTSAGSTLLVDANSSHIQSGLEPAGYVAVPWFSVREYIE